MATEVLVYLLLGAAAGGFINGLAGFGTSLFALGFWLQILAPLEAVSLVVVISVLSGLQGIWLVRRSVLSQPKRLARFLLPAIFGIPIGVAALAIIEPKALTLAIAGIMLIYGGFFHVSPGAPEVRDPDPDHRRLCWLSRWNPWWCGVFIRRFSHHVVRYAGLDKIRNPRGFAAV